MCHLELSVKKASDTSFAQTTYFVGFATLGVAGLITGIFKRKRKERVQGCGSHGCEEDEEMATNFELVHDNLTA
jgi:hypothetical protein